MAAQSFLSLFDLIFMQDSTNTDIPITSQLIVTTQYVRTPLLETLLSVKGNNLSILAGE